MGETWSQNSSGFAIGPRQGNQCLQTIPIQLRGRHAGLTLLLGGPSSSARKAHFGNETRIRGVSSGSAAVATDVLPLTAWMKGADGPERLIGGSMAW